MFRVLKKTVSKNNSFEIPKHTFKLMKNKIINISLISRSIIISPIKGRKLAPEDKKKLGLSMSVKVRKRQRSGIDTIMHHT